ncbi:hypothetical protein [Pseudomonas sp. KCJK8993]|uniref:hypothetical protein n=1 Tax=Pseudomonas sp. KCJK8993 TaxID=3344565 RepID=UPI0039065A79
MEAGHKAGLGVLSRSSGAAFSVAAGGSLLVSAQQKLMVEAHYANGHEIEQPLALTLGYRYLG